MGSLIHDAHHIYSFVQNHTNSITIYEVYTHLSLLKITYTHFTSSFNMLKRLREVKTSLGAMVISKLVFLEKEKSNFFKKVQGYNVR
jgi:hypothetical protein